MYDRIERLAQISVARGVGFAALTVFCFMISFAGDTINMLRAGGTGALLITVALWMKAANANPQYFKRTEVWIMLDKPARPPDAIAAGMVTAARRAALMVWAYRVSVAAVAQLAGAFIWQTIMAA